MEKGLHSSLFSLHLLLNSVWFGFLALYSTKNGLVKDLLFACPCMILFKRMHAFSCFLPILTVTC